MVTNGSPGRTIQKSVLDVRRDWIGMRDTKILRLRHRVNDLEDRIENLEQVVNDLAICFTSLEEYVKRR